jgi:hypothetical protein
MKYLSSTQGITGYYIYYETEALRTIPDNVRLRGKRKHNRPLWVAVQGLIRPTPYTYIEVRGTGVFLSLM